MADRRNWRGKRPDEVIIDENPKPSVSYVFDARTPRALFEQVVGAASSTRFWNGLPGVYPFGAGEFIPKNAAALVEVAVKHFESILHIPELTIETEKVLMYNDETMQKVADALRENGLSDNEILDCINSIQNRGILFRERFPGG